MAQSKRNRTLRGLLPAVSESFLPPISFVSKARKADKTECIKLEFYKDPGNPDPKYARHFIIFKDGCAEDWVKWLMAYREVKNLMTLKEHADKQDG